MPNLEPWGREAHESLQLAQLESLAVYFDTDSTSLAGLSYRDFVEKFTELVRVLSSAPSIVLMFLPKIAHNKQLPKHQFILKPVSGQGRVCASI